MKITGHHALVTGGGSGIGLAIAQALLAAGNNVTIVGRNEDRLLAARKRHPSLRTFAADLATSAGLEALTRRIEERDRDVSLLVNNAGAMRVVDLGRRGAAAGLEYETNLNLVAPMHLSAALLPILSTHAEAAIVNVSTALIYAPVGRMPAYSASKAGLHAFTRALRWHLAKTNVRVVELVPPPVDTEMAANVRGSKLPPEAVAKALMDGLVKDASEIAVGPARAMQVVARLAPEMLYRRVNMAMNDALAALPEG